MEYIAAIVAAAAVVWALLLMRSKAVLAAENARLRERLNMIEDEMPRRRQAEEDRFRTLAAEILDNNSKIIDERHRRELILLLNPLKQDIETFSRSVSEAYQTEMRERHSLSDRIRELVSESRSIGTQASRLATALSGGGRVQGDWGEMVLETILEQSGLRRGEEFIVQQSVRNADGLLLRPDVIVNYPGGRCIVVDSKVSLSAFMELSRSDTNSELAAAAAKRHVQSVRNHISELRRKNYQDNAPGASAEFVMMFIPNEAAYIEAMRLDPGLWQEACNARVIIVSPTHLVAALKLVEQMWQQDRQARNAAEIAVEAGRMYDKFAGFVADMDTIGKTLDRTRHAFDDAMNKLTRGRGNLTDRARALKLMGAKTSKTIREPDESDTE